MTGERLKVLRVMNTIAGKVSWKEFLEKVGLSSNETLRYMQELVKMGFLKQVGHGYSTTDKGRVALKYHNEVPENSEFHFYTEIGRYTGLSAGSLKDFRDMLKKVDVEALEFHVQRGDFENWISSVFEDKKLVNKVKKIRKLKLKGEKLRKEILNDVEMRCKDLDEIFYP